MPDFEHMTDGSKTQYVDSSRLKQVNLELGPLVSKHRACRMHSGLFSGLGAVLLAVSLLGLFHLLPAGNGDWTQNPNSPVYAIATQQPSFYVLKTILVATGFMAGLASLYTARRQCSQQRSLWKREGDLRREMVELRDRLYIVDQLHNPHEPHPARHPGHTTPLDPDDARSEYVGVYNPPESHRELSPEKA